MKPPVEAPRSAQTRPAGSTGRTSSALSSLSAPRDTYFCGAAPSFTRSGTSGSRSWPGLVDPGLARRGSPATTAPAMTSACAWVRDAASPRSTRRRSTRWRRHRLSGRLRRRSAPDRRCRDPPRAPARPRRSRPRRAPARPAACAASPWVTNASGMPSRRTWMPFSTSPARSKASRHAEPNPPAQRVLLHRDHPARLGGERRRWSPRRAASRSGRRPPRPRSPARRASRRRPARRGPACRRRR